MINYLIYGEKGEILRYGSVPTKRCAEMQVQSDKEFLLIGNGCQINQYILNGEVVDKKPLPVDVHEDVIITLPEVEVFVDGVFRGISDTGEIKVTKTSDDTYTIKLVKFPFQCFEVFV